MSKRNLFNLLISFFLFTVFTANVAAQDGSCPATMEVTLYNSEASVTGATATAVNSETKKVYKSALRDKMPYFADLPEGDYRVTVSKHGYMRSADDFSVFCASPDDENNVWAIELYKGSSTKIVKIYNRPSPVIPDRVRTVPKDRSFKFDPNVVERDTSSGGDGDSTMPEKVVEAPLPPLPPKVPKVISGGVVNGKATSLPQPVYPAPARAVGAKGAVNVAVTIDEEGNVVSASATSGHPLLRAAAVAAARRAKFPPTTLSGQPVSVKGILIYNFN